MNEEVLRQEIEFLTKERDDARIELIAYDAIHGKLKIKDAARARGWGYLVKENKNVKE